MFLLKLKLIKQYEIISQIKDEKVCFKVIKCLIIDFKYDILDLKYRGI